MHLISVLGLSSASSIHLFTSISLELCRNLIAPVKQLRGLTSWALCNLFFQILTDVEFPAPGDQIRTLLGGQGGVVAAQASVDLGVGAVPGRV